MRNVTFIKNFVKEVLISALWLSHSLSMYSDHVVYCTYPPNGPGSLSSSSTGGGDQYERISPRVEQFIPEQLQPCLFTNPEKNYNIIIIFGLNNSISVDYVATDRCADFVRKQPDQDKKLVPVNCWINDGLLCYVSHKILCYELMTQRRLDVDCSIIWHRLQLDTIPETVLDNIREFIGVTHHSNEELLREIALVSFYSKRQLSQHITCDVQLQSNTASIRLYFGSTSCKIITELQQKEFYRWKNAIIKIINYETSFNRSLSIAHGRINKILETIRNNDPDTLSQLCDEMDRLCDARNKAILDKRLADESAEKCLADESADKLLSFIDSYHKKLAQKFIIKETAEINYRFCSDIPLEPITVETELDCEFFGTLINNGPNSYNCRIVSDKYKSLPRP